jgi:predicted HAD superfamily Cof-like phosphohydrolase
MIRTNFELVKEMHKEFGNEDPSTPDLTLDSVKAEKRAKLIFEECKEALAELGFDIGIFYDGQPLEKAPGKMSVGLAPKLSLDFDPKKLAKELADVNVVVYGTAAAFGIDADVSFREVNRSNMSKIGPAGEIETNEWGKVMKGSWYKPADMTVIFKDVSF